MKYTAHKSKVIDCDYPKLEQAINHVIKAVFENESSDIETIKFQMLLGGDMYHAVYSPEIESTLFNSVPKLKPIIESGRWNLGLYNGLSDLALCLHALSQKTGLYQNFLHSINSLLIASLPQYIAFITAQLHNRGASPMDYDVINGLSGILNYLFLVDHPDSANAIRLGNTYFVELLSGLHMDDDGVVRPNYHIRCDNIVYEPFKSVYPTGYYDLGLAHGVAAPLMVLARSYTNSIEIPGQQDCIKATLGLYERYLYTAPDTACPYWEGKLPYESINSKPNPTISRMSWCYGSIGILRALQMGARATGDKAYEQWTMSQFENLSKLPIEKYMLHSPTLCHGYTSVLSVLNTVYKETRNVAFVSRMNELIEKVLSSYNSELKYGFPNIESDLNDTGAVNFWTEDNIGILNGGVGVALSLFCVFHDDTVFDRFLLLN